MKQVLAFDVYGTLIDTQGVMVVLEGMVKDKALLFSETWRSKQLEYSFRRGLMKRYEGFSVCTKDALNYTCEALEVALTTTQKKELLTCYETLPVFDDVKRGLSELQQNYQLVAFSNGEKKAVEKLLTNANIAIFFNDIVTADEIQTFKPDPKIYQHLLNRTYTKPNQTWLISSNPFDVIGAKSFGMNAAWIKRNNAAIYDTWGIEPTMVVRCFNQLSQQLRNKT
jgi:2-haloacid dehalogenase